MKTSNHLQVVSLHHMWETLCVKPIQELVSKHIQYESYWVSRPIRGRKRFLDYFRKELQTIKDSMKKNYSTIVSQVVHTTGNEGEYCLILKHLVKGIEKESLITVSVANGKITKMGIEPIKRNSSSK